MKLSVALLVVAMIAVASAADNSTKTAPVKTIEPKYEGEGDGAAQASVACENTNAGCDGRVQVGQDGQRAMLPATIVDNVEGETGPESEQVAEQKAAEEASAQEAERGAVSEQTTEQTTEEPEQEVHEEVSEAAANAEEENNAELNARANEKIAREAEEEGVESSESGEVTGEKPTLHHRLNAALQRCTAVLEKLNALAESAESEEARAKFAAEAKAAQETLDELKSVEEDVNRERNAESTKGDVDLSEESTQSEEGAAQSAEESTPAQSEEAEAEVHPTEEGEVQPTEETEVQPTEEAAPSTEGLVVAGTISSKSDVQIVKKLGGGSTGEGSSSA